MTIISVTPMSDLARAHEMSDTLRTVDDETWNKKSERLVHVINRLSGSPFVAIPTDENTTKWAFSYASQVGPKCETPRDAARAWCNQIDALQSGSRLFQINGSVT